MMIANKIFFDCPCPPCACGAFLLSSKSNKSTNKKKGLVMYKISSNAANALWQSCKYQNANTCVFVNDDNKSVLLLWGHRIAWKITHNTIGFSLCGWDTRTTCERLRACGVPINHKKGVLCCGNVEIDDCTPYSFNVDTNEIKKL